MFVLGIIILCLAFLMIAVGLFIKRFCADPDMKTAEMGFVFSGMVFISLSVFVFSLCSDSVFPAVLFAVFAIIVFLVKMIFSMKQ